MTGKELVLRAIEGKKVERIPWVPFCGVHTGHLLEMNAEEYLKSTDNIVAGLSKAVELYRPDGLPVIFDLQVEAEVLGCDLIWSKDNPPAVVSHPLAGGSATLADLKVPAAEDGRIPMCIEATSRMREKFPDLALYGLITGPFTLALHLRGADIFMDMFDEPEKVHELLKFCVKVSNAMSDHYITAGCDIVAVVDPMTSQIGPEQFSEFCHAPCAAVFDHIRQQGVKGSFFVCGHAKNNIEVMCDCRCDNISIDENIPLDYVRDICRQKGVSFGGNLQLTTVMLLGSEADNKVNAIECMDIGGYEGFILAPGCDMPFAAPPENVQAVAAVVHSQDEQAIARELAKTTKKEGERIDMFGYGDSKKVKIDVVTLDSLGCAPCQYMVEEVKRTAEPMAEEVEWKEHKIKDPMSIVMMNSLGVKNIPTLCIDGEIAFVSRIPSSKELAETIQKRINRKRAKGLM
jgi:MtaA/CmuA family methyltransferase